jgi:cytidine deaminase
MLTTLDRPDRELVEQAQEAAARAYAPYSHFAVGAAVRSKSGAIYAAANLENASSGLTICAEAAALSLANSAGDPDIDAIAVVGFNFTDQASTDGAAGASRVVSPCGSCRQLIAEAAQRASGNVRVICCNGELSSIATWTITELLPNAFGPENLTASRQWPALQEELRACVQRLIAIRKKQ